MIHPEAHITAHLDFPGGRWESDIGSHRLYLRYLNGVRARKDVGGVEHSYIYASGKLLRETYGNNTLDFFYDSNGTPFALKYNGTLYYYITNLQGDVMNLVDASGTVVATYDYDPFGNVIVLDGTMATTNPLCYRGYYYDSESGLYYLQSRYYDPELGRFINADSYASTGQGIIGHNMFTYCNNNPVCLIDSVGFIPTFADMDPGAQTGIDFGYWLSEELLKPDRDSDGQLTCGGKIKILFNSIRKNIEFSAGVGQGYYAEFKLFDFGGSVGAYGNYATVDYSNERWRYGQEVYIGASVEIMQWLEIGGAGYEFYQNGRIVTSESWMGLNSEKESWTLFSLACYPLFLGGSIRLGFDVNTFLKDTEEVWGRE